MEGMEASNAQTSTLALRIKSFPPFSFNEARCTLNRSWRVITLEGELAMTRGVVTSPVNVKLYRYSMSVVMSCLSVQLGYWHTNRTESEPPTCCKGRTNFCVGFLYTALMLHQPTRVQMRSFLCSMFVRDAVWLTGSDSSACLSLTNPSVQTDAHTLTSFHLHRFLAAHVIAFYNIWYGRPYKYYLNFFPILLSRIAYWQNFFPPVPHSLIFYILITYKKGKKYSYPCNWPWTPIGLWDVEAPTIGSQMAVRLSALRAGRPLPLRKIPCTHFC
jgi:hypothetical protein